MPILSIIKFFRFLRPFILPALFYCLCFETICGQTNTSEKSIKIVKIKADYLLPFKNLWDFTPDRGFADFGSDNVFKLTNLNLDSFETDLEQKSFSKIGIFLSESGGKIKYIDAFDGHLIWSSDLGGEIVSNVSRNNQAVLVLVKRAENYILQDLNNVTGIPSRQIKLPTGIVNFDANETFAIFPDTESDKLFIAASDGQCFAFELNDGRLIWNTRPGNKFSTEPIFSKRGVFAAAYGSKITLVSENDGSQTSSIDAKSEITSLLFGKNVNNIIYGDRRGFVSSQTLTVNKEVKKIWQMRCGGAILSVISTRFGLLISSLDNYVYLISAFDGNLIWKKRTAGRISAKPAIFASYAVIANLSEPGVEVVDLHDGRTVNRIAPGQDNASINSIYVASEYVFLTGPKGLSVFTAGKLIEKSGKDEKADR